MWATKSTAIVHVALHATVSLRRQALPKATQSSFHLVNTMAGIQPRKYIKSSSPYPFPYDGLFTPDNTALIIIDMQV